MFESAVGDSSHELVLQQEVAETSGVNADVAAFLFAGRVRRSEATFGGGGAAVGGRLGWLDLLIGIIDEILFVRHDDDVVVQRSGCGKLGGRRSKGVGAWQRVGAKTRGGRRALSTSTEKSRLVLCSADAK